MNTLLRSVLLALWNCEEAEADAVASAFSPARQRRSSAACSAESLTAVQLRSSNPR